MESIALPIGFAVFVWWFSTGIVLYLNGLPRATHDYIMVGASLTGLAGFGLAALSGKMPTEQGAYLGFLAAIAIWAWNEIGFLLGHFTGTRKAPCPSGIGEGRRFILATQTLIYHELTLLASLVLLGFLLWTSANPMAFWVYGVLWLMRLSTKLNIFLGVPNTPVDFLPVHLRYVASYFRNRPMNGLFPLAVTASTLLTAWLYHRAIGAGGAAFPTTYWSLLAAFMTLAVLEHWFLVVPLPFEKLWQWGLASRRIGRRAAMLPAKPAEATIEPAGVADSIAAAAAPGKNKLLV